MKITISEGSPIDPDHEFILNIKIENNESREQKLPLRSLSYVVEKDGIRIRDQDGEIQEPAEFLLINPANTAIADSLAPSEFREVILSGTIVEVGQGLVALKFSSSTYVLKLEEKYTLSIKWSGCESDLIPILLHRTTNAP
jgi:hypothetical protein